MNENLFNDYDKEISKLSENQPYKIHNNEDNTNKRILEEIKEKETKINYFPKKNNNYICKKKGNTYIITVDKDNNPIFTVGPEWIYFAILSTFITVGFLFLCIFYYSFTPLYLFIPGFFVYFIFIFVYTKMFISNPGFAKGVNFEKEKSNCLYCSFCKIYVNKNSKIVHCSKCGLCIEGFDHHCGWIGKCIAKKNLYEFYFLIFWIVVIILFYTATFVIAHLNWLEYELNLRKGERIDNKK